MHPSACRMHSTSILFTRIYIQWGASRVMTRDDGRNGSLVQVRASQQRSRPAADSESSYRVPVASDLRCSSIVALQPDKGENNHRSRFRRNRSHNLTFVSQNCRGLKNDSNLLLFMGSLSKRKVFAACIQETWRSGSEEWVHDGNTLIMYGLDRDKQSRRGLQGVGIYLSKDAIRAWEAAGRKIIEISARIIALCLHVQDELGNIIKILLVSAYAPIGSAPQDEWEKYLGDLSACITRYKSNGTIIIGTDCNSSMGRGSKKDSYIGRYGMEYENFAGRQGEISVEMRAPALNCHFFHHLAP